MGTLAENLALARQRVETAARRAGREPSGVRIMLATKGRGVDQIALAVDAGQTLFGENRVQEAALKLPALPDGLDIRMIGHLQRNKVNRALSLFSGVDSVDSVSLARAISLRTKVEFPVMLEVRTAEETKSGFEPEELMERFPEIAGLPRMRLEGLFTVGPLPGAGDPREAFRELRLVRDSLQERFSVSLPELSMGMSDDFEQAVEEGATVVRLGRAVFGERA